MGDTLYRYAVWAPDGQEAWTMTSDEQLATAGKPPSFTTVLQVDTDVDAMKTLDKDPIDSVRYYGPMYFDLDNDKGLDPTEAREKVLEHSRQLLGKLHTELQIPTQFIHCWLSGSKGVHVTIAPQVFGVQRPMKALPWVWKIVAQALYVPDLDMGIYSHGQGRMWRQENVQRTNGKYKVPVTFEELRAMTPERYEQLVSEPRPNFSREQPGKSVNYLEASKLGNRAKEEAQQMVRDYKKALKETANLDFGAWPEVPGCIDILINEGDCDLSNWNQASMQLASWIAARFNVSEQQRYQELLIEPFLKNVESSSRSYKKRKEDLNSQLKRARQGHMSVRFGAIIKTTGQACGNCPICKPSLRPGEEGLDAEDPEGERVYHHRFKIRSTPTGYTIGRGEKTVEPVTNFTFTAEQEVYSLVPDGEGGYSEGPRTSLLGTLRDSEGKAFSNFTVPESAWISRSAFMSIVQGHGNCTLFGSDSDLPKLFEAIMYFSGLTGAAENENEEKDVNNRVTVTDVSGIIFERPEGPDGIIIPHYVEKTKSIMGRRDDYSRSIASRFRYQGDTRHSPSLLQQPYPYKGDTELEQALKALMHMNDPAVMARIIGWAVACHLREHLHTTMNQFPLLNIWGGASAGKSTTAALVMNLTGYDFREPNHEPMNMQIITSVVPLLHYLSTSTTVPRMLEEYNNGGEGGMSAKLYGQAMGYLQAAWDRTVAPRGKLERGGRGGSGVDNIRISAPILFCSENRPTRTAMRNRTVECLLSPRTRETPEREKAHNTADRLRRHLLRAAKALVHRALNTDPRQFTADYIEETVGHRVPKTMDTRPRYGLLVVFLGLDFLKKTMKDDAGIDIDEDVDLLIEGLQESIKSTAIDMDKEKRASEVTRMLRELNRMAQDGSLQSGLHYSRVGSLLHLYLDNIVSPYRIHCRKIGTSSMFQDSDTLSQLLQQERYFERTVQHEEGEAHTINLLKAKEQDILSHGFKDDAGDY